MKILIIHHFCGIGGGFKSCLDIAKMIKNNGHDVTIALPSLNSEVESVLKKNKIKYRIDIPAIIEFNYHSASSTAFVALIKYFISLRNRNKWRSFFAEQNYDLIILNSLVQAPLIKYIKEAKKKSILFIRETIRKNRKTILNKFLSRKIVEFDAISFLTKYDQESWGIKKGVIQEIIPDIVDIQCLSIEYTELQNRKVELNIHENTPCFLYLGGLCYIKGALDVLLAFNRYLALGNKGHLFMLGSDYNKFSELGCIKKIIHMKDIRYSQYCKRVIKAINNNGNNITFVGLVEQPEDWYLISDIVIFPVKKVHQARPIYEAGFFKKTVIVPRFPNFSESVIENYNGLYYMPGNIEDLSEKMIDLAKNRKKRNELGKHNMELYEQIHTFKYAETKLNKMLDKL